MLKNYLTVALRTLWRHRGYTFINVTGLAVGLACCLLILLYVRDELSYDRHHEHADRIYRVVNERRTADGSGERAATPPALAPALRQTFPEVQASARLFEMGRTLIARGDQQFFEERVFLADPSLFDILSLPLLKGDPATALREPFSMVLTEAMAEKYFGGEDPVGQTLELSNRRTFTITGVLENLPEQSHLHLDFLGAFASLEDMVGPARLENWIWQQFYTYALLPPGLDPGTLEEKLPAFVAREADPHTDAYSFRYTFWLQPVTDIHLHAARQQFDFAAKGDAAAVYAFSLIALFILAIACINFTNLATARSAQRAREVGVRKVVGAGRAQLTRQFLGESVLLALVALCFALLLVELALPAFNAFSGKSLVNLYRTDRAYALGVLGTAVAVGALAGLYPAFVLAAFKPLRVLKQHSDTGAGAALRKGLVVVQFAISIALLIGTGVVFEQTEYARSKHLGFDETQVVTLPLRTDAMQRDYETLKAELLRNPAITHASASYGIPGGLIAGDDVRLPGDEANTPINMIIVDYDFIETYGMEMVAGRRFSRAFTTDSSAFILNETAVQTLGWGTAEQALDRPLLWDEWGRDGVKEGTVIGVVKDFHFRSLHHAIEPMVLHIFPSVFYTLSVRIRPENVAATLGFLQATWREHAPEWPFEYAFLDQDLDAKYKAEEKLGQLFGLFALLAVGIACLGLFGLASFTVEQRTKEIGIRKVLGASVSSLMVLLSGDVFKLALVAFGIAAPLAVFAMNHWLGTFAYHVEIGLGLIAAAGLLVLAIALATVSFKTVGAALADPVESLRYE